MADVLVVGDTLRSPELRHEVPVAIGDAFLYAEAGGRRVAIVWSVEGDRIAEVDPGIEIVPSERFGIADLVAAGTDVHDLQPTLFSRQARSLGIRRAHVPAAFPLHVADVLRRDGVELVPDQRLFDDRRRRKTPAELAGIRTASAAAVGGIAAIARLLARSEPGEGGRVLDGEPLTCELLRAAAEDVFAEHGCRADTTTVAHGAQAADGHDPGSGRVATDDVVLCDLFPQHVESACHSDMSRTFRVGAPDPELEAWHAQCVEALALAASLARPGVEGGDLHRAVCRFFEEHGHPTQLSSGDGVVLRDGFYHALGHGVGLDVHEAPRLGRASDALIEGDVIALEPGLYRHGATGVRVEDLVVVGPAGVETLTAFPTDLDPADAVRAFDAAPVVVEPPR